MKECSILLANEVFSYNQLWDKAEQQDSMEPMNIEKYRIFLFLNFEIF